MFCRFGQSSTSNDNDIISLEGTTKNIRKETEDELLADMALQPQQTERSKRVKRNQVLLQQVINEAPESVEEIDTEVKPSATANVPQNGQTSTNITPISVAAIDIPMPASIPEPPSKSLPAYDPTTSFPSSNPVPTAQANTLQNASKLLCRARKIDANSLPAAPQKIQEA